ncbi:glycosyltransferase family 39 protein [Allonocardiopsis opalescens]|uniref:Mannosyltransferase n=1 Tax=Allonocardiopsis opalescens TaxID=1144618 RepID=A0A2T0Q019_9ACTN|nr:glycosyltransferase family 39 protein [Allonocardiopsis opalescens]PRX97116.1 mannosyltransferase [Allonocardiopsis opalescens]
MVELKERADGPGAETPAGWAGLLARGRAWLAGHWVVAVPGLAGAAMAFWGIAGPSYRADEGATITATTRSLVELAALLRNGDAVHGPFYLLMHPVAQIGTREWVMRAPMAVAMVVAVVFTALIARRLVSPAAALFAGLVLALAPTMSWYAHDARSYALVTALATVSTYCLVRLVQQPGPARWRGWAVGYTLATAAMALLFMYAALLLAAHLCALLVLWRRTGAAPWRPWLITTGVTAALVLPIFVVGFGQRGQVGHLEPPTLETLEELVEFLAGGPLLVVVLVALVALGAARSGRDDRSPEGWTVASVALPWLLAPPALLLIASVLVTPTFHERYTVMVLPALALLAGAGLAALRPVAAAVGLVLVAVLALPVIVDDHAENGKGDNLRIRAEVIGAYARPGDGIMYAHSRHRRIMQAYPDMGAGLRDVLAERSPADDGSLIAPEVTDLAEMERRIRSVDRLWVIVGDSTIPERAADYERKMELLDDIGAVELDQWVTSRREVRLYEIP